MKSITDEIFDGVINELDRRNFLADDDPEHKASAELEATLCQSRACCSIGSSRLIPRMRLGFAERHMAED